MQILSHRGFWQPQIEKNSIQAFYHSFARGFGVETDIRDHLGDIVISHDPPTGGELLLHDFLVLHRKFNHVGTLALNVKADGLHERLRTELAAFPQVKAFVFDMSVPDARSYLTGSIPIFTRQSELEPICAFYEQAKGVWLDAFDGEWYDLTCIANHLRNGKQVCLVSPELHGRSHHPLWNRLAASNLSKSDDLLICTDRPEDAHNAFAV